MLQLYHKSLLRLQVYTVFIINHLIVQKLKYKYNAKFTSQVMKTSNWLVF